ncbi:uracil-DNA glycosylase [Massilia glaciei]|uniref:Uracil-DNA glycosylase n=1 Tax=Massilia glaciei TaxID=1524097 RepID=A0A2U2HPH9_9BURK|nr:uracil-DNA glycosylase [Massilia glaciei]PWF49379.1 uracil-DNA glycosylase [Massilia glaciei]
MSGTGPASAARAAIFLEEMGIGPLWTLRDMAASEPETMAAEEPIPAEPAAAGPRAAEVPPIREARATPLVAENPAPALAAASAAAPTAAPIAAPSSGADSAWGEEPPAAPATDEEIAAMDWPALRAAIDSCTRCGLCKGARRPVHGDGARAAQWLVAAGASTAADEKERAPLAGDPGRLLDNMLAAVALTRADSAYVTNLIKCRPTSANGGDRAPTRDEALACRPYLERELALTGARVVLTLGQIAANGLLDQPLQEPLAGSRGAVHAFKGVPMVATLHPGELLRRGADKALAWADLCMAKAADAASG